MATHTEYTLRCPCIFQIFNLPLAIATPEASRAECLIACENSKVLNLVATCCTTVRAIVANERSVAQKEEVRIRVKQRITRVASETINMPTISGYPTISTFLRSILWSGTVLIYTYLAQMLFPLPISEY